MTLIFLFAKMMKFYPANPLSCTKTTRHSYLFDRGKNVLKKHLFMVKNKQTEHSFIKKPIKRGFTMSFLPFYCWGRAKGF